MQEHHVTVLGDGAFGTACAILLAHNGYDVTLWCYNSYVAHSINTHHENRKYLPGITLSEKITATDCLERALAHNVIFEAIPMMFLTNILHQAADFFNDDQCWVSLTKGITVNQADTIFLPTDIIETITKNKKTVVVSGPSYAHELTTQQPTGFVVASNDQTAAHIIADMICNDHITAHISADTNGVQMIAALKNVCAIGIGILDGIGYGSNTQALFIMQALEEIKFIFSAYKIPEKMAQETIYGLAGIGDLMLTCFGKKSRNYTFGCAIGRGEPYDAIVAKMGIAPEGVSTLKTIEPLSKKYDVKIPLFLTLRAVVFEKSDVKNLIAQFCK